MNYPLVSMVMITGKAVERQPFAIAAMRSYCQQTWPNKELVIINDGAEPLCKSTETEILTCPVREFMVPKQPTLGDLRNIGLEVARGDWIMQADDDDWSHPFRLERQMHHAKPGLALVLAYQIRYSFPRNSAYVYMNKRDGIAGTILHPRTKLRYESLERSEDSIFLRAMQKPRAGVHKNSDLQHLYLRFFHDTNTWDEAHVMRGYTHQRWKNHWADEPAREGFMQADSVQYLTEVLREAYGLLLPKIPWTEPPAITDSIESN